MPDNEIATPAERSMGPAGTWWRGSVLVALVAVVYVPTLDNGFIWDDDAYVTSNMALDSLAGLRDIWFNLRSEPQYYPLVHTTYWIEYHLWELRPLGFHLVNLLLHAASAVLVWRLLARLAVPGAWLAAAIFAVHPVQVESVAWVTERKNVLSLLLALGSLLAYLRFSPPAAADDASRSCGDWRYYVVALVLYVGALLSKTVTASVPAVLLVIYWWKNGRVTLRQIGLLAPLFIIGLVMAYVTVSLERTHVGAVGDEWNFSSLDRVLIAGRALWFYAFKLAWPHPLVFFYPRWTIDSHQWWQYLYPAAFLGVVVGLWSARDRIGRGPLAAVLIFAGVLVPALGFFNVYPFRFSFVADHFQYHASISLIALAAAVLALAAMRLGEQARWFAALAAAALVLPLAVVAHQKTHVYKDVQTLYEDTLALNPDAWAAHYNLGNGLRAEGRFEEAIQHFRAAIRLQPNQASLHNRLGSALYSTGRLDEAKVEIDQALKGTLGDLEIWAAHVHLGNIAASRGKSGEAVEHYHAAVELRPSDYLALYNWGMMLAKNGEVAQGLEKIREGVRLNPKSAAPYNCLGNALSEFGSTSESIELFETAVRLQPAAAAYRDDLAAALLKTGNTTAAEEHLREAIKLNPKGANSHNLLGVLYAQQDHLPKAIAEFEAALKTDPKHQGARENLQKAIEARRGEAEAP